MVIINSYYPNKKIVVLLYSVIVLIANFFLYNLFNGL